MRNLAFKFQYHEQKRYERQSCDDQSEPSNYFTSTLQAKSYLDDAASHNFEVAECISEPAEN